MTYGNNGVKQRTMDMRNDGLGSQQILRAECKRLRETGYEGVY
jgi:hypothetical protein